MKLSQQTLSGFREDRSDIGYGLAYYPGPSNRAFHAWVKSTGDAGFDFADATGLENLHNDTLGVIRGAPTPPLNARAPRLISVTPRSLIRVSRKNELDAARGWKLGEKIFTPAYV